MPFTPKYSLPYPKLANAANVPYWMQQLAAKVEAHLDTGATQRATEATTRAAADAALHADYLALDDRVDDLYNQPIPAPVEAAVADMLSTPGTLPYEAITDTVGDVQDPATAGLIGDPATATGQAGRAAYVSDQSDFVELIRNNTPRWVAASFRKIAANRYQVRYHNGIQGVTYQLIKDTNDDFIKLDACFTGAVAQSVHSFDVLATPADLTGAWTTSTASWYTTAVGAKFTSVVPGGSAIALRIMRESRGGRWSISVDGAPAVNVSCWDASSSATEVLVTIATGLDPNASHTIVGTFTGDDPANAPSSAPSRGYVRNDAVTGAVVGYVSDTLQTETVLADGSNKELAFTPKIGANSNWVPDHGVGSAFKITDPVFVVNGAVIDAVGMAVGASIPLGSGFELRQRFNGQIAATATNALEFTTTHRLDAQGLLTFAGRFVALTSCTVMGYPLMLPGMAASQFVTGIGNVKTHASTDTEIPFTAERDDVFSAAVLYPAKKNLIAAGTLTNPRLSYRRGRTQNRAANNRLFLWDRPAKPKLYWSSSLNWNVVAGDAYTWSFKLMVADFPGAYRAVLPD